MSPPHPQPPRPVEPPCRPFSEELLGVQELEGLLPTLPGWKLGGAGEGLSLHRSHLLPTGEAGRVFLALAAGVAAAWGHSPVLGGIGRVVEVTLSSQPASFPPYHLLYARALDRLYVDFLAAGGWEPEAGLTEPSLEESER